MLCRRYFKRYQRQCRSYLSDKKFLFVKYMDVNYNKNDDCPRVTTSISSYFPSIIFILKCIVYDIIVVNNVSRYV